MLITLSSSGWPKCPPRYHFIPKLCLLNGVLSAKRSHSAPACHWMDDQIMAKGGATPRDDNDYVGTMKQFVVVSEMSHRVSRVCGSVLSIIFWGVSELLEIRS